MLKDDAGFAEDLRVAEKVLDEQIGIVEKMLEEQIGDGSRQKDPWAYADLGTVRLLRGKPDALAAYRELEQLRPPKFVYDSTLTTLQPICEVASDLRPDLLQAVAQLRRSARHSE